MALPTAATPGYGFYPTYGSNPDVACNCQRAWLPVFMRLLELKGLGRIVVWNCVSDLEASGNTHYGGGATDWGGISRARAMLAREMGAIATWPRDWTNNQHTHSVLYGCPHTSTAADYQITACLIYRRDGLGYHGLAGPDPLPLPSTIRTWEQGITWAKAEIERILEEQMPTPAELWAVPFKSPENGESYAASSWLIGANVKAGEAKAIANQALAKVNAHIADRDALIADVRDAVLNAPVANHDENPDDNVVPQPAAFRSYSVMANWRASQIQGEVAELKQQNADLKTALDSLIAKVDALPKG